MASPLHVRKMRGRSPVRSRRWPGWLFFPLPPLAHFDFSPFHFLWYGIFNTLLEYIFPSQSGRGEEKTKLYYSLYSWDLNKLVLDNKEKSICCIFFSLVLFFLKKGERRKRSQPIGWSAWANNPAAESTSASVDRGTLGLGTPLAGLIHMLQSTEQAMRDTHTHTKKGE